MLYYRPLIFQESLFKLSYGDFTSDYYLSSGFKFIFFAKVKFFKNLQILTFFKLLKLKFQFFFLVFVSFFTLAISKRYQTGM